MRDASTRMSKIIADEARHIVRAAKLIELLQSLPEGCYVAPLGNLAILRLSEDDIAQIGFIDLGVKEEIVLYPGTAPNLSSRPRRS
jgi:hypothetical protein